MHLLGLVVEEAVGVVQCIYDRRQEVDVKARQQQAVLERQDGVRRQDRGASEEAVDRVDHLFGTGERLREG